MVRLLVTHTEKNVLAVNFCEKGVVMSIGLISLIVLVLLLVGALPRWPHSYSWGYFPSSGLGVLLVIVVILVATGRV